MADLVTSESRRYLHGIQKETNDTTELPYTVPVDNQVTYIDSFTNYGLDTVYGKEYVIAASSGRADASGITNTPTGNIAATTVQAAINELDSEKGGLAQDNTWAGSNTFTQALTALQFVKSGGTSGQFLKADGSVDSSSYESTITAGTTSQYYRGDKTWQTLDTAAVTESTNLYFTNARVLGTVLTGLNTSLTGAVVDSDTILAAIGKLENRVAAGFSAAGVSSFNTRTGAVTLTSGDVTGALGFAPSPDTHTHTFASLTSKPTTLSGYGITDAASSTHTHTFASLTSKPTTLSGYGITDAASSTHTHPASSITNTPTAPITSANVQGALNEVASLANSASSAASSAQSTANSAASAAAYADRLARSSHNLIKNGNSEDPNPTGYEAAWISDSGAYTGTRCRALTVAAADAGWYPQATVGEAPCDPGDQFVFTAWGKQDAAHANQYIFIEFLNAAGARAGIGIKLFQASTAYTQVEVSGEAPAGSVKVRFIIYVDAASVTTYYWDCLYATRKVSVGMIEATGTRDATTYLRGDGVWAPVTASLPSTGSFAGIKVTGVALAAGANACWLDASGGGRIAVTGADSSSYGTFEIEQYSSDLSQGRRVLDITTAGDCCFRGSVQAPTAFITGLRPVLYFAPTRGAAQVGVILQDGDYLYMGSTGVPSYASMDLSTGNTTFTGKTTLSNATASTSTSTGAIVVSGGVGCADYFTGKYRSSDGTAGLTTQRTFYAASSSGGATNVRNTVTIKDGIITSWTQA